MTSLEFLSEIVICNSTHSRFNNLINEQRQAPKTMNTFLLGKTSLLLACHNVVNHASESHATTLFMLM